MMIVLTAPLFLTIYHLCSSSVGGTRTGTTPMDLHPPFQKQLKMHSEFMDQMGSCWWLRYGFFFTLQCRGPYLPYEGPNQNLVSSGKWFIRDIRNQDVLECESNPEKVSRHQHCKWVVFGPFLYKSQSSKWHIPKLIHITVNFATDWKVVFTNHETAATHMPTCHCQKLFFIEERIQTLDCQGRKHPSERM